MTTFANGESGLSVRTKINNVLQHADGTAGELVINEAGADVDFRVESDTNANALFVDGATGNVGIGTSSPSKPLHLSASAANTAVRMSSVGGSGRDFDITSTTSGALAISSDLQANLAIFDGINGNVGIGVTPSAWDSTYKALEVSNASIAGNSSGPTSWFANNVYVKAGTGSTYKATAPAAAYLQSQNQHQWFTAPSGTAGNPITFTQAMTLDASGNLLIGTTSSGGSKLRISGLPTSSAGLSAGDVWNDGGTLKIA